MFDETVAGDSDFQLGELGSVEELPVLEGFQFFVPAKTPDRFGSSEERVG
jgi:hypothetical protein